MRPPHTVRDKQDLLQETDARDGRICYELVKGDGPASGWVTPNLRGKEQGEIEVAERLPRGSNMFESSRGFVQGVAGEDRSPRREGGRSNLGSNVQIFAISSKARISKSQSLCSF